MFGQRSSIKRKAKEIIDPSAHRIHLRHLKEFAGLYDPEGAERQRALRAHLNAYHNGAGPCREASKALGFR